MSEKLHYKYNELIKSMVEYVGGALSTASYPSHSAIKLPCRLGLWEYSIPSGVRYYCLCAYDWGSNYHNITMHMKAIPTDDTTRNLIQYMWANVWIPKDKPPVFTIDVNTL